MANIVQWRAFVGPRWKASTDSRFWNWASALTYGSAYEPLTDMPNTTLSSGITAASTTLPCVATGDWPSTGGCWVGPNGSGQNWEYIDYGTNSSNTLGSLSRGAEDSEFSGTHSGGAVVKFWWELTSATGTVDVSEFIDRSLSVVDWTAELRGVNMPQAALINDHLILVQIRQSSGSTWGSWTNELVGWIDAPEVQDDYRRRKEWTIRVRSAYGFVGVNQVGGVQVGQTELTQRASASASSVLSNPYKAYGLGEFFETDPLIDAGAALDASLDTLWMSENYIGLANNPANPGTATDGLDATAKIAVTQAHLTLYPGQNKGYRWLELTVLDVGLGTVYVASTVKIGTAPDDVVHDYIYGVDLSSYTTGDRLILAENQTLFEAENPGHGAAAILTPSATTFVATHFKVSTSGATSGTFQITDTSRAIGADSGSIAWNASASDCVEAINDIGDFGDLYGYGGPLNSADVYIVAYKDNNIFYGDKDSIAVKAGWSLNATPVLTKLATGNNGFNVPGAALNATQWFDSMALAGGLITVFEGLLKPVSTVRWGTFDRQPGAGFSGLWNGANVPAITGTDTLRYIYAPTTPSGPADYWQSSQIHTPGYNPNGSEWLLFRRPALGLRLLQGITDVYTGVVSIGDLSGAVVPDGIANSGTTTLQIGLEQITVTRSGDTITITGRGANSTTAAAHVARDVVYVVESSVAVDAFPMTDITIKRLNATVPAIYNAKIYGSRFRQPRSPDQDGTLADWTQIGADISANTSQDVTRSISATRYQWILIVITAMETQPYRACINGIEITNDSGVYNTARVLSSADAADVIERVLENSGIPSAAITDNGSTSAVDALTTASDYAASVASDLAELTRTRITVDRCSAIDLDPDPIFDGTSSYPAASGTLDNGDLLDWNFGWDLNRTISQVELLWKDTSGIEQDSVFFPSGPVADGRKVRAGPYIYANAGAAAAGAEKLFYTRRVPFDISAEIADSGRTYRPGQVYTFTWPVDSEMSAMSRKGLIISADHRIGNGAWKTVVHALQIGRTDRR